MVTKPDPALAERIYTAVLQIPSGTVASYGEIATVVGGGVEAREVGYALGDLPTTRQHEVPWQRVVARDGAISTRGSDQRMLLEAEGVAFDEGGHVIMARHAWRGPDPAWAAAHGFHTLPNKGERGEQLPLL